MFPIIATALFVTFGVACYYAVARRRFETRDPKAQIFEILLVTTGLLALVHLPSLGFTALLVLSSIAVMLLVAQALARWLRRDIEAGELHSEIDRPNADTLKSGAIILVALALIVPYVFRSPLLRESVGDANSAMAATVIYLMSGALVALAAGVYVYSQPVEIRERGVVAAWRCILWKNAEHISWRASALAARETLTIRSGTTLFEIPVPEGEASELREWLAASQGGVTNLNSAVAGLQPAPSIPTAVTGEDAPLSSPVERSES